MVVADEGRQDEITRAYRKMTVFNPIPSKYGQWEAGKSTKNIPLSKVIEDPVFKQSHKSFFVQLADCVAFALLKREVPPTPNVQKYGINSFFEECLAGVCFRKASPGDVLGDHPKIKGRPFTGGPSTFGGPPLKMGRLRKDIFSAFLG